jgi:hypothetical protein
MSHQGEATQVVTSDKDPWHRGDSLSDPVDDPAGEQVAKFVGVSVQMVYI